MADLEIKNLHVRVEDREILKGVDLSVSKGEVHALMGPNGSGKSTLANTIMGHPGYEVTDGHIVFRGEDITEADPEDRAQAGLFLAFQYPAAIPGVSLPYFDPAKGTYQTLTTDAVQIMVTPGEQGGGAIASFAKSVHHAIGLRWQFLAQTFLKIRRVVAW